MAMQAKLPKTQSSEPGPARSNSPLDHPRKISLPWITTPQIIKGPIYCRANARVGGQLHAPIPVAESVIGGAEAQFQVRSAPKSWGEWGGVLSFCVESDEQAATGEDFGLLLPHAPHAQVHRMRLRWVLCRPQAFTNLLEAPAHLDLPRPGWLLATCTVALALSPAPAPQSSPVRRENGDKAEKCIP